MSVLKLYSDNPEDGVTSFNKTEFGQANDGSGTGASVIATADIDTATADIFDPGFTNYTKTDADLAKYFSARWKNSTTGVYTDWAPWVLGGQDRWDDQFKKELNDTAEAVWTTDERAQFRAAALEALYPEFWREVVDTSLTIAKTTTDDTLVYTVPFGIFQINEVGVGDINDNTEFRIIKGDYWRFEKNILRLADIDEFDNGDTIRIVGAKKLSHVGEVPRTLDPLVMLHLRMSAYLSLADDYPRFLQWAQLQQGSKVSFENLRLHAREYERKFFGGKARIKRMQQAQMI